MTAIQVNIGFKTFKYDYVLRLNPKQYLKIFSESSGTQCIGEFRVILLDIKGNYQIILPQMRIQRRGRLEAKK